MPWDSRVNKHLKIIEISYSGNVSPAELRDALHAAVSLSKKEAISLFLANCTEMAGGHSVSDLYFLISIFESSGINRRMKEALLMPSLQSSIEDVKFYEIACQNKGYNVKIFTKIQDALTWLSG